MECEREWERVRGRDRGIPGGAKVRRKVKLFKKKFNFPLNSVKLS